MPDSSGATVFDDLPEWLVVDDILIRLPPKDILRCRAVRKSWRSGTSIHKFILDHHRRQPSLPIIEHHKKGICRLPVLNGAGAGASSDKKLELFVRYAPGTRINVIHHAVAVCDGLLILSEQDEDGCYSFYICNPAIRRCASLPHPPRRPGPGFSGVMVFGFYQHHTSGEYRVLLVVYSISAMCIMLPDYFVVTVGSDQPRPIQWPTVSAKRSPAAESSNRPLVHLRGSLHWATGLDITIFDTEAETFRQMSRPAQLGRIVSLLDMSGALALCSTTRECVTLDVWVLQDYDAETWGFQYRINLLEMVASPRLELGEILLDFGWTMKTFPMMDVINERELLIKIGGDRLLHCDIDGVFLGNVECEEPENSLKLTRHRLQESMISLPLFETPEEDAVKEPPFVIVL